MRLVVIVTLVLSCTVTVSESEILQDFCAPDLTAVPPKFWGVPLGPDRPFGVNVSRYLKLNYSAVKFFLNSKLCEKHTRTSRTDRQTEDLLWHITSRGKNAEVDTGMGGPKVGGGS